MGYSGYYAVVIPNGEVKKVVPDEYKALEDGLKKHGFDFSWLGQLEAFGFNDVDEEIVNSISSLCIELLNSFYEKTGINIFLEYHNSEDYGDIYDDVNDGFFSLFFGDVFQLTPKALDLQNKGIKFDIKTWVSFG